MDRRHRAPQKTQDGRETKSHSQTEAESGGSQLWGRERLAHMDIPVASDGRVGSALRAPWCQWGGAQHGVSGQGGRRACPPHFESSRDSLPWLEKAC